MLELRAEGVSHRIQFEKRFKGAQTLLPFKMFHVVIFIFCGTFIRSSYANQEPSSNFSLLISSKML